MESYDLISKNQKLSFVLFLINILMFFYHSCFSDYCLQLNCYIHNVLADVSSSLFQVFLNKHGTSNHVLYLIDGNL